MKTPIIAGAIAVLATATFVTDVQAAASSPAEHRGYEACLSATADSLQGLTTERSYLLSNSADQRTYYINATAWQDGQRAQVGITCATSKSGRDVLSHAVTDNRYAAASSDGIQVAGQ